MNDPVSVQRLRTSTAVRARDVLQMNDLEPYDRSASATGGKRKNAWSHIVKCAAGYVLRFAKKEFQREYQVVVPLARARLQRNAVEIGEASKVKLKSFETAAITYAKANPFPAIGIVFVGGILVRRLLTR